MEEELSTGAVVYDHEELGAGLEGGAQREQEGVEDVREDEALGHRVLDLLSAEHLSLAQHFHRIDLSALRACVSNQIHFPKATNIVDAHG
jgi:hypothetical protein